MEYLPTIRQLQYLDALAEQGSFSRAALECMVTQSTLSAGIKELESLLGRQVVDRSTKSVTLTAFGRNILDNARLILLQASEIKAQARALGEPLTGPLRMGIIPTIAPYLLPSMLPKLKKQYPDLELQLTEDLSARIYDQLRLSNLDVILLAFPYDTPSMKQTLLFEEPFYLACPKGVWEGSRPSAMADLENKELLLLEEGHCLRDHALEACEFRALAEKETFNATSLPTLIQFVQHGYGMTILPEMAVKQGALPENIDVIPFKKPVPTRKIGMAWRDSHPQASDFELLAKAIKKIF